MLTRAKQDTTVTRPENNAIPKQHHQLASNGIRAESASTFSPATLKPKEPAAMATPQQIEANRKNAQQSTGPVGEDGKKRSSLNATRHGFTGQSLVLTADEQEAYQAHVNGYFADYQPVGHEETELLHQYADLRWTLHQISIQQQNLLALMNAATRQLAEAGDPLAAGVALTPFTKMLNTLTLYEQRRRRAADETQIKLRGLSFSRKQDEQRTIAKASAFHDMCVAQKKPFVPSDFGFVCSMREIEEYAKKINQANELVDYEESLEDDEE